MGAEADAVCGAGYGQRSSERVNSRNGYRHREFDTRAGTLDLAIAKLRQGSYFLDWLLERRKRAERAVTTVVATCYLLGVSTRRMDKLVETLGITSLSKSQVSWGGGPGRPTAKASAPARHQGEIVARTSAIVLGCGRPTPLRCEPGRAATAV